jgi:hypothetical protein
MDDETSNKLDSKGEVIAKAASSELQAKAELAQLAAKTLALPSPSSKRKSVILGLIAFVLLLATVSGALYVVTQHFGVKWSAILGLGGAFVVWLVRASIEKRREYERLLNQEKRNQYSLFIDVLNKFMPARDEPEHEMPPASELRKWSMKLMLVGSDDVIRAWNVARNNSMEGKHVVRNYGRLLLAMRRDSGHHYTKLRATDMLESFVNDIDEEARKYFDE